MAAAGGPAGALRARLPMNGTAVAPGGVLSRAHSEADEDWDAGCDHCMPLTRDPAKLNDIRLVVRYALAANAPTRKDNGVRADPRTLTAWSEELTTRPLFCVGTGRAVPNPAVYDVPVVHRARGRVPPLCLLWLRQRSGPPAQAPP